MRRLSRDRQAMVSMLALLLVLLVVGMLLAAPVLEWHARYDQELIKDERILQRLRGMAAARQDVESAFAEFEARSLAAWGYASREAGTVELDIQRRVADAVNAAEAQMRSVSPVSAQKREAYLDVGVRVTFSGSLDAAVEVLQRLEYSVPILLVRDVRITPQGQRARRDQPAEQTVEVQMHVSSLLSAEVAPAAGGVL
ncbi:MAG: type II secretion system protein GspM [Gammaproteobacteria bacterium]|nr:type II secretion system protein GspM [Gammaproteobacteria bacterium]